ncbi:hypothetical protein B0J14DRAFT_568708 [Halenospora varia]|nr:hypothetical protein B0J14DRAFT_568708 [Halenospora varia]
MSSKPKKGDEDLINYMTLNGPAAAPAWWDVAKKREDITTSKRFHGEDVACFLYEQDLDLHAAITEVEDRLKAGDKYPQAGSQKAYMAVHGCHHEPQGACILAGVPIHPCSQETGPTAVNPTCSVFLTKLNVDFWH